MHNWHIFLTIRHINGIRAKRSLRIGEQALLDNIRVAVVKVDAISEDIKSINQSGFRQLYPPIVKHASANQKAN